MKHEGGGKAHATEEKKWKDDSASGSRSPYAQHDEDGNRGAARIRHDQSRPDDQRAGHPKPQGARYRTYNRQRKREERRRRVGVLERSAEPRDIRIVIISVTKQLRRPKTCNVRYPI